MTVDNLKAFIVRIQATRPLLSVTAMRVVVGLIFVKEGTGKLFGWFNHGGPEITAAYFRDIGIPLAHIAAYVVGAFELVSGGCLILGLLTRVAVIPVSIIMLTAIATVHANVGYAYPIVLCSCFFVLLQSGGGSYSADLYLSEGKPHQARTTPFDRLRDR